MGAADQAIFTEQTSKSILYDVFECYYLGCFSDVESCVSTCIADDSKQKLALTQGCRDCHGDFVGCIFQQCGLDGIQCFLTGWSGVCDECFINAPECPDAYKACSGIDIYAVKGEL